MQIIKEKNTETPMKIEPLALEKCMNQMQNRRSDWNMDKIIDLLLVKNAVIVLKKTPG